MIFTSCWLAKARKKIQLEIEQKLKLQIRLSSEDQPGLPSGTNNRIEANRESLILDSLLLEKTFLHKSIVFTLTTLKLRY